MPTISPPTTKLATNPPLPLNLPTSLLYLIATAIELATKFASLNRHEPLA
jgi:hypothetical protein